MARRLGRIERGAVLMKKITLAAALLAGGFFAAGEAQAFCLLNCEPKPADAQKVFDNLIKKKFDPDAKIVKFEVDRFWPLDVEGAGHAGYEFYFQADVEFPKGAHLECKPAADGTVAAGCSASTYYSTTIQNQMIKDKQYIEPGKTIHFKDETRFDQGDKGWKGQDGNFY
jgi:hypothetical protein